MRNWKIIVKASGLTLLVVLWSFSSHGQFTEVLRTGRPGFTIGSFTVGKGYGQIQSGIDVFGSTDASNERTRGILTNTVFRYGLGQTLEAGMLVEYRSETLDSSLSSSSRAGWSNIDIGLKKHVLVSRGPGPDIGLQVRFRIPNTSNDYPGDQVATKFMVVVGQQLSEKVRLIINGGGEWDPQGGPFKSMYTLNLQAPITASLGTFVEAAGSVKSGRSDITFQTGLAWLLSHNLQLDVYGSYGDNHGLRSFLVSTGVSWRFGLSAAAHR